MKIWTNLRDAVEGWLLILRGETGWHERFSLTAAGLGTALALFYFFAFIAIVLASFEAGVPTLAGFIEIMFIQSLWLVALLFGLYGTRFALRSDAPLLPILIPGIYAMTFYLVLGSLVSLLFGLLLPLLWVILAWMLYRLGRIAAGWPSGISAAFAGLTLVLLVGLPMTLYMLATSFIPAA